MVCDEGRRSAGRTSRTMSAPHGSSTAASAIDLPDKLRDVLLKPYALLIVAGIRPKAMPVMLAPDDYDRWLEHEACGRACELAKPCPDQHIRLVA